MDTGSSSSRSLRRPWTLAVAVALGVLTAFGAMRPAHATTRVHALVIGNNQTFARGTTTSQADAQPLRYADDDAAAFSELVGQVSSSVELLTVMDRETQALYPNSVSRARVPTLGAVKAAVERLNRRIADARSAGGRDVVFVFFSGHGAVDVGGQPALALFDGGLGHDFLYREILEKLRADELHLLIDACHAEAVVRPRDAEAEIVEVSLDRANAFLVRGTLARFPHVGAILAATTNAKAHEWDAIRHGIFSHELLSALRGAADVNRDRRIEYSEVFAFMAAANREVQDSRARLALIAKPPDMNRRTALLTLSDFPHSRLAWLTGIHGASGIVEVSDSSGRRLATLHGDVDFVADLLLPADSPLFVRHGEREARFRARSGEIVDFRRLRFGDAEVRSRGALEDSIRRGLFAAPYGRRYYEGVVDQSSWLTPVDFADHREAASRYWSSPPSGEGAFELVLGGGVSRGVAAIVPVTHGIHFGLRPVDDAGPALSLTALWATDGPLTERHFAASAGFVWPVWTGRVRGLAGAMAGAGWLNQAVDGLPERHSASLTLSPVFGLGADVAAHWGVWSELALSTTAHREDERWVLAFMPSAWLGGSLRLP